MSGSKAHLGRTVRLLATFAVWASCSFLSAAEKYSIGQQAQVIVVGNFVPSLTTLWFDGWYINGVITVDDILYARSDVPHQIHFRMACTWKSTCRWWPPPRYPAFTLQKGLWFLRENRNATWEPASFPDTGFRSLADRADWEKYIRRFLR